MTYLPRILDEVLEASLGGLPAAAIDGAKGVGKSATAERAARSVLRLDRPEELVILQADRDRIRRLDRPVLIDEWQRDPPIWDAVRRRVDADRTPGQFILTGSANPRDAAIHSGAGRIVRIRMRPLSFAERRLATPTVSVGALLTGQAVPIEGHTAIGLTDYVTEILASGFPGIRTSAPATHPTQVLSYLEYARLHEVSALGAVIRRPRALEAWPRAYAAATATTASFESIADAVSRESRPARATIADYREVLHQLWLLDEVPAWLPSGHELTRLGQAPKHHLADPALAARLLGVTRDTLLNAGGSPAVASVWPDCVRLGAATVGSPGCAGSPGRQRLERGHRYPVSPRLRADEPAGATERVRSTIDCGLAVATSGVVMIFGLRCGCWSLRGTMKTAATLAAVSGLLVPGVGPSAAHAHSTFDVKVATFNICNVKCGTGDFAWEKRAPSVVRNIVSSRADVVTVQEADKGSIGYLSRELEARGYSRAVPDSDSCARGCVPDSHVFYRRSTMAMADLTRANAPLPDRCRAFVADDYPDPPFPRPELPPLPEYPQDPDLLDLEFGAPGWEEAQAENEWRLAQYDAQIAEYRRIRERREVLAEDYDTRADAWRQENADCRGFYRWTPRSSADAGSVDHDSLVGASRGVAAQNRNMAWAVLRHRANRSVVFAASVHLPNEKTGGVEQVRTKLARAIPGFLRDQRDGLGVSGVPILIMGDLNSYWQRQPRGAQWILGKHGFRDAYTAKKRINPEVPTINVTSTRRNPFPAKPFRFDKPARLDYVLFDRGKARRYEVHVRLKGGRFDNRYRSSDHNLVRATLRLPSVTG